jgi:undecaprenyl-diphosphatase
LVDLWKAIVMGIVEGLTEFLPISSTGHLIVASALLDYNALGSTFEIFIQLGGVIAILIYYSRDLWTQAQALPRDGQTQRFWLNVLIAFVPAALIGFLLSDWIDAVLFNPTVVAVALIVGGVVFIIVERAPKQPQATTLATELMQITPMQACWVGIAQTVALIPGVSRSGASMIGGMLVGLNREVATQFSFYLAIPTLGAATAYQFLKALRDGQISGDGLTALIVATIVATVTALIAIRWLLRYVASHSLEAFGYYRIIAGAVILLLMWQNVLR